jgi:hypothetical protein
VSEPTVVVVCRPDVEGRGVAHARSFSIIVALPLLGHVEYFILPHAGRRRPREDASLAAVSIQGSGRGAKSGAGWRIDLAARVGLLLQFKRQFNYDQIGHRLTVPDRGIELPPAQGRHGGLIEIQVERLDAPDRAHRSVWENNRL